MKINKKNLIFISLLLISPFFWHNFIINYKVAISQYRSSPNLIKNQVRDLFSFEKSYPIGLARQNSAQQNNPLSFLLYNKSAVFVDQFFYLLENISPKQYFVIYQRPFFPETNPLIFPIILPFSILGFAKLLKKNFIKYLFILITSGLPVIITGQPNPYFLAPTAILYLYSASSFFND